MLKSRNVQNQIVSECTPQWRVRGLAAAVGRYKRWFAASTTLVILLAVLLFGFVVSDEPDRFMLGVGTAGMLDTSTSADTLDTDATGTVPQPKDIVPPVAHSGPDAHHGVVDSEVREGAASYYGDELAGRPTASGESFDPQRLTAAHRTLPFGTRLRVTNIRNGKSVVVRINDRGPFSGKRALDLSYSAARQIGMLGRGIARVRMEVIK